MTHEYNSSIAAVEYYKDLYECKYAPQKVISFADELLEGRLTVGYEGFKTMRYNPHKLALFNWNTSTAQNANTFSLYLLGLRHLFLLAHACELKMDRRYLELADDFVSSFYQYQASGEPLHGMIYNDHTMAERIENLVYLHYVAQKAGYQLEACVLLVELITDSVNRLLGDKYYLRNHNHGIIVDKAALTGIYFLNKPDADQQIEYVVNRLKKQVDYAYYQDGVHKENSIDYHISVSVLLWGCYHILKHIDHTYRCSLYETLKKANEFIVYALKPDNFRPLFGDSKKMVSFQKNNDGTNTRITAMVDNFNNDPSLEYIASKGQKGSRPDYLSRFFPCGYVFFREHFLAEDYENATWMSLKAGFTTRVHKHRDDLSICLYSKGFDIFIDSGMCGYMPKDRFKEYMESVPAHTAIGIRNIDYTIANGNGEKVKIQRFTRSSACDYAMASSKVYDSTTIYRHVYYLRQQDIMIIRDEICSDKEQVYAQYFNLSNEVMPGLLSKAEVELRIGDTPYTAVIRQLQPIDELNMLEGDKTDPGSFVSTGFGSNTESKTLEYLRKGKSLQFVTVVEIKHDLSPAHQITLNLDELVIHPGKIRLPFHKTREVRFRGAEVTTHRNKVKIVNQAHYHEDRYSFYVFTGSEVIKHPYKSAETLLYEHKGCDDFVLLYYVANQTGELEKGILGDFRVTESGVVKNRIYQTLHRPVINKQTIEPLDQIRYRFVVDLDYDYPVSFSWWIYYNGSCIKFEQNDRPVFEFACSKAGEYVAMCSLRDKYFSEFYFHQFDKVIIQ